jgi:hypothetical protein
VFVCTKLANERPIQFAKSNGDVVNLNAKYQNHLSSQGKSLFDPFRRNPANRFKFTKHGKTVETTIAQLRFFRFIISEEVIPYCESHFDEIEKLMRESLKKEREARKAAKKAGKKKKATIKIKVQSSKSVRKRRRSALDGLGIEGRGYVKRLRVTFVHPRAQSAK